MIESRASANDYDFLHLNSIGEASKVQRSVSWRVAATLTNCYNLCKRIIVLMRNCQRMIANHNQ
jgi:hypothetical protein